MPHLRITFTPHPVATKTADELRAYVEGNDPVSGKPMMKEIVDDLTVPLSAEEKKTGMVNVSVGPENYGPDTPRNLQQFYHDNGMTDFLPIILPTEEMVDEMLAGTTKTTEFTALPLLQPASPPITAHRTVMAQPN